MAQRASSRPRPNAAAGPLTGARAICRATVCHLHHDRTARSAYCTCVTPWPAKDAVHELTPTRGEIRTYADRPLDAQFGWFVEPRNVPIGLESLG